jgi:hypothetical protein
MGITKIGVVWNRIVYPDSAEEVEAEKVNLNNR